MVVNERQAEVIKQAVEFYSRIKAGQLQELWYLCYSKDQDRQQFEKAATELKKCLFPDLQPSGSYGIGQDTRKGDGRGDVAWDIHEVVRHRLAWDRAGNPPVRDFSTMMGHDFDKPTSWSGEPLAEMTEIKHVDNMKKKVGK